MCFALSRSSTNDDVLIEFKLKRFTLNRKLVFRKWKSLPFFFHCLFFLLEKKRWTHDNKQCFKCQPYLVIWIDWTKSIGGFDFISFQLQRTKRWWNILRICLHRRCINSQNGPVFCCSVRAVFDLQYFLRVDCVMSEIIRQFARKILLNSKLRKRLQLLGWPIKLYKANYFFSNFAY